jgi:hypothetical protein
MVNSRDTESERLDVWIRDDLGMSIAIEIEGEKRK